MSFPFAEAMVLHSRAGADLDDTGGEIPLYEDSDLTGAVWPNGPSETGGQLDVATGTLSVDVEGWPAVSSVDEVTVRGLRYAVTGDPSRYRSPFTGMQRTGLQLLRRT